MKANYHTHVKLCNHATGMSADYVKEAIKSNYEIIGISDHGPIPRDWMSKEDYEANWLQRQMTTTDYTTLYLPDIEETMKRFSAQIKIYKGLEIEYVEGHDDYYWSLLNDLDYLLLGVHYYFANGKNHNSYEDIDYQTVQYYADNVEKALATGFFSCLVHPDLYLYGYVKTLKGGPLYFDEEAKKVAHRIIQSCIRHDVYLEINCGGINKGKHPMPEGDDQYLYPRNEFWKIVSEYKDVKVVIGADAHQPSELSNDNIASAKAFAKKHGITVHETMNLKQK